MAELSLDDFSQLTAKLYDAAVGNGSWADAIDVLKRHVNASQVSVGWFGEGPILALHGDTSPYYENLFFNVLRDNLILRAVASSRPGVAFQDQDLLPRAEFQRTEVFNEWFVPQGQHSTIGVKFVAGPGGQGIMSIVRGGRQPAFSETDMALINQLMPPLTHALTIRRRLDLLRVQQRGTALDSAAIGFVVTDSSGLVLHHNETAERQFAGGNGLTAQHGRLVSEQPSRLAALIAHAAAAIGIVSAGGETLITTGDDRHPAYAVSVGPAADGPTLGLPMGRGAMVFIQALNEKLPASFEERMQRLFGLTPKEASLAAALASGHSLKDAADARFISVATARTQLAQIFRKTNTTQQSQMVSLLLRVLPVTH